MGEAKVFMFTRWMESLAIARSWLEHFERKGIPAGIVSRAHHPPLAVWRCGEEAGEATPVKVTHDMIVREGASEFERAFNQLRGR